MIISMYHGTGVLRDTPPVTIFRHTKWLDVPPFRRRCFRRLPPWGQRHPVSTYLGGTGQDLALGIFVERPDLGSGSADDGQPLIFPLLRMRYDKSLTVTMATAMAS